VDIGGIKVLALSLEGVEAKSLRDTLDQLKSKLGKSLVVLVAVNNEKVNVVAGMSRDCLDTLPEAKEWVAMICGRGGGRPDMAQGGGPKPDDLDQRLAAIIEKVKEVVL